MGTAWKDKLHEALWAYRTSYKTPLGMSPYQLVYRKSCHLAVELEFKAHFGLPRDGTWTLKWLEIKEKYKYQNWRNGEKKTYYNSRIYKERTKRWHDKRIKKKEFKPRDKVLLFNFRVKLFGHGKLRSKWEGPFKVIYPSPHGAVTLQNNEGTLFKVNGHRLNLEPENIKNELDIIEFIESIGFTMSRFLFFFSTQK